VSLIGWILLVPILLASVFMLGLLWLLIRIFRSLEGWNR